jgi:uncharacterized protein YraI
MRDEPKRILGKLLILYGPDLHLDARRTEALLRDYCPEYSREIFVLVNAQKQRAPVDLLAAPSWLPQQAVQAQIARRLEHELSFTAEAATWAVEAWATALQINPTRTDRLWVWLKQHTPSPDALQRYRSNWRTATTFEWRSFGKVGVQLPTRGPTFAEFGAQFSFALRWLWQKRYYLLQRPVLITLVLLCSALVTMAGSDGQSRTSLILPVTSRTVIPGYSTPRPAWIHSGPLVVRSEPSSMAVSLGLLPTGQPVMVAAFSADGAWAQIELPAAGWVSSQYLRFRSEAGGYETILTQEMGHVGGTHVNVRAGPGLDHEIIGRVQAGETVVIVAAHVDGTWKEIVMPLHGWVSAELIDIEKEAVINP